MLQKRYLSSTPVAVTAKDEKSFVDGVAVVYNALSEPLKFSNGKVYKERFLPGAFTRSLAVGEVICTIDHDLSKVIGRKSRNTLVLEDDEKSLRVSCNLPLTTFARDLVESITRGDVQGMSFTFNDEKQAWTVEDGMPVCSVREASIHEVCFSSLPAYPQTSVSLRSMDELKISNERKERAMGITPIDRLRLLGLTTDRS